MYVVRNRESGAVLLVAPSAPGEELQATDIYPDFDPDTMELGSWDHSELPAWFTIENGRVMPLDGPAPAEPAAEAPPPSLEEVKARAIAYFSRMSLELRLRLIPDYQVQNAALGIYDEARTRAIRDTIAAFRDEYHRLEAAVLAMESLDGATVPEPAFPTELVRPSGQANE
jgi:hypothetical protein